MRTQKVLYTTNVTYMVTLSINLYCIFDTSKRQYDKTIYTLKNYIDKTQTLTNFSMVMIKFDIILLTMEE